MAANIREWSGSKLAVVGLTISISCIAIYAVCVYYLIMYMLNPTAVESWTDIILIGILFDVATDLGFIFWATICCAGCILMAYYELRRIITGRPVSE